MRNSPFRRSRATKKSRASARISFRLACSRQRRSSRLKKNLDESQMADFSTAIEDVMPGPGRMMQDEVMGPPMGPSAMMQGNKPTPRDDGAKGSRSKNPLGLTDDQFMAVLAGVAGVIAFSKPVQGKLSTMVPKFLGDSGEVSTTGLAVTALLAAIIFYFAKQFLKDKA
ncbi:hypothetical protein [Yellowstone lake phycodnavirus 3]|uniref:hypothetical protein n=1 Tax=Yellowstone lake phycodnavirus 3 TaxID=1586715 RepID=UPI0006EBB147|nr:hypothetical protein AR677_gp156 [Yellowstone lake phycodnavirus 3]BAT22655.1 hypothetical protein [Yellowstone lake phycodnavirus 3]